MVQLSLKRKMKVLFVIDRLQDDDFGVPLGGHLGLKLSHLLLQESIPFGRLIQDRSVAKATGHSYVKRIGVETMFTGEESYYPDLLRGNRQTLSTDEDYYKTVQRYAKHLLAVHSKCTKLHTIVLFGRSTQRLFQDALTRLEEENEHVAATFQSMTLFHMPAVSRMIRDERINRIREVVVELAPSNS
ncbi:hypothetical protein [Exiguobacterium marinum]|uniref:hypothetical protein n=1 Tax=Exiguobacterium marinum TaxID=273528 RepID=UPI00047C15D2|nr:hypothetical protein [Exiguobacterium marinum]